MPFTKFSNLDFDQIKTSIKDYLRANSNFTDFDFEGSNFSVLIDTLAYNTYITAFNSNMIVNESFLDSATLRQNVVSLARNIGYVPRSRTSAKAKISFDVDVEGLTNGSSLTLNRGIVCVGSANDTTYTFSTYEDVTTTINDGVASFSDVTVYQGTLLRKSFVVDGSLDQRFLLANSYIDSSTITVFVAKDDEAGLGFEYKLVDNILNIDSTSRIYLLQEVQDEKYELLFGDGIFGEKLENGSSITVFYIISDGEDGNGASQFSFAGSLRDSGGTLVSPGNVNITTSQASQGGSEIESISSIKYYAPKNYSAQSRAVTARDYEAIIQRIYPDAESISIVGGEELSPPKYGTVVISIKPKNGTFVSDFDKSRILSQLKQYSVSGINQEIIDLKILYVEIDSSIYYNYSQVSTVDSLKSKVLNSLTKYSESTDLNKFGGRLKYSKLLQVIDKTDTSITSNITKIRIRRDLKAKINQLAQYELCYGNKFHVNSKGFNIKSTGFKISGEQSTVYLTDTPNADGKTGILSIVKPLDDDNVRVVVKSAGTVDYVNGEIMIGPILITSTDVKNDVIEIQAFPDSNDVIGLKDLYLDFNISKSTINMVRDVISSGDEISGTVFARDFYTSSYSNGNLIRK